MSVDQLIVSLSPAALVLVAMFVEFCLPPLRRGGLPAINPFGMAGVAVEDATRKLDRAKRGEIARLIRGALVVALVVAAAGWVGWWLEGWTRTIRYGGLVHLGLLVLALDQRGTLSRASRVGRALGNPAEAARLLQDETGRRLSGKDRHAAVGATIELGATAFAAKVAGPALWYLALGLPGLVAHRTAVAAADALDRRQASAAFALAGRRLADAFCAIPALVTVPLIAVATLATPGARAGAALATALRDRAKHESLVYGWPVGAFAGALGVSIQVADGWIGPGRARAEAADLTRSRYLFVLSCLTLAAPVAAAVAYLG